MKETYTGSAILKCAGPGRLTCLCYVQSAFGASATLPQGKGNYPQKRGQQPPWVYLVLCHLWIPRRMEQTQAGRSYPIHLGDWGLEPAYLLGPRPASHSLPPTFRTVFCLLCCVPEHPSSFLLQPLRPPCQLDLL